MKEEHNQRFTSFNQLNKRIYLHGVDGGWIFTFIGIIVAISFVISIVVFRQPLPALGIGILLFTLLFRFLQRYKRKYNQTGLDDPFEREMEESKQLRMYRDDGSFLS